MDLSTEMFGSVKHQAKSIVPSKASPSLFTSSIFRPITETHAVENASHNCSCTLKLRLPGLNAWVGNWSIVRPTLSIQENGETVYKVGWVTDNSVYVIEERLEFPTFDEAQKVADAMMEYFSQTSSLEEWRARDFDSQTGEWKTTEKNPSQN